MGGAVPGRFVKGGGIMVVGMGSNGGFDGSDVIVWGIVGLENADCVRSVIDEVSNGIEGSLGGKGCPCPEPGVGSPFLRLSSNARDAASATLQKEQRQKSNNDRLQSKTKEEKQVLQKNKKYPWKRFSDGFSGCSDPGESGYGKATVG
eukprot:m.177811 g.177811  ORF g.177811 m.177811 type:complete len:148 (-) comp25349_c0_seq3:283-726(-)